MKLIERSNTTSLQSLLTCSKSENQDNVNLLLKLNLLSRLQESIKRDLTELEFKEYVPKLAIKISKFNTENGNQMYLSNLNTSSNLNREFNLPQTLEKEFSDLGIVLPSKNIFNDRLNSFSELDVIDPFRLTNLELEDTYTLEVQESDFSSDLESDFFDTFYAGTNANEELFHSKVRATCILAISDILEKEPNFRFDKDIIDSLLRDVTDLEQKSLIAKDLNEFISQPSSRATKIIEAKKVIKLPDAKDKQGKPIATWKLVTAVTVILLGVLAYTQRDAIKTAFKLSKEPKDFEPSKFKLFTKSLFTKGGREFAKNWINLDKKDKKSTYFINSNPWRMKKAEADQMRSRFEKEELKKKW